MKRAKGIEANLTLDVSTVGNTIEVNVRGDWCSIALEHPWHGDSESGFGATLSDQLTPAQAAAMGDLLLRWAKSQGFESPSQNSHKEKP